MARITVEDCLEKVDNQYDLVLLAKERTVQLNAGAPMLVEEDNDKRTIISLREIGDGKIDVKEVEASAIKRLRREPDESEETEEVEEKVEERTNRQLRKTLVIRGVPEQQNERWGETDAILSSVIAKTLIINRKLKRCLTVVIGEVIPNTIGKTTNRGLSMQPCIDGKTAKHSYGRLERRRQCLWTTSTDQSPLSDETWPSKNEERSLMGR